MKVAADLKGEYRTASALLELWIAIKFLANFGSSGRTRSLPPLSNTLKISKLLNTNTEVFRLFRWFRLFHISLGQFLGQKILEAVACLAAHFLSDG